MKNKQQGSGPPDRDHTQEVPRILPAPGQEGFPGPLPLHNHLILKGPFLQHQIDCLLVNLNFTP